MPDAGSKKRKKTFEKTKKQKEKKNPKKCGGVFFHLFSPEKG